MINFTVSKYGHTRFWAVRDSVGELVCICVYKRGAVEVARRLQAANRPALMETASPWRAEAGTRLSLDSLGHSQRSAVARLTLGQNAQQNINGEKT